MNKGMGEKGWWRLLAWAVELWERDLEGVVRACQEEVRRLDEKAGEEDDEIMVIEDGEPDKTGELHLALLSYIFFFPS